MLLIAVMIRRVKGREDHAVTRDKVEGREGGRGRQAGQRTEDQSKGEERLRLTIVTVGPVTARNR